MPSKLWLISATLAAGITAGCVEAAPYPVAAGPDMTVAGPTQTVQYWEDDDYARRPRRSSRPRGAYGGPAYDAPPPYYGSRPGYGQRQYYGSQSYGGNRGYSNREAAKDYVKDYRRNQKEIHKDKIRGWNRSNGF